MDVEIFTVCDFAQDTKGKLTIVGTFDFLRTKSIPTKNDFSIAARLRFNKNEVGEHGFKIKLIDPSGDNILPGDIDGGIKVDERPHSDYTTITFSIRLTQITFKKEGQYWAELNIDNELASRAPIKIIKQ